ncbi:hypothetical protein HMI55_005819, partial [Coelomomyces lativittatus]
PPPPPTLAVKAVQKVIGSNKINQFPVGLPAIRTRNSWKHTTKYTQHNKQQKVSNKGNQEGHNTHEHGEEEEEEEEQEEKEKEKKKDDDDDDDDDNENGEHAKRPTEEHGHRGKKRGVKAFFENLMNRNQRENQRKKPFGWSSRGILSRFQNKNNDASTTQRKIHHQHPLPEQSKSNPFQLLEEARNQVVEHPFPDHLSNIQRYSPLHVNDVYQSIRAVKKRKKQEN